MGTDPRFEANGCIWPLCQTGTQDPVLIWPAAVATAKSAMVVSLGFSGTMGDNHAISCLFRHMNSLKGFSQCPYLVQLDQNRIADALLDAAPQDF